MLILQSPKDSVYYDQVIMRWAGQKNNNDEFPSAPPIAPFFRIPTNIQIFTLKQ